MQTRSWLRSLRVNQSPLKSPLKSLTEHVSVLDVYYDLPYIRQAVFSDPDLDDGEKLMWWALILVMLEHGCRISEVSVYSPLLSQVPAACNCGAAQCFLL